MKCKIRYKKLHRAEYARLLFYIRGLEVSGIHKTIWGWYVFEVAISELQYKTHLQPI